MGAILSKPRDPTEKECHGYNCKWDNGIFTPSSNSEGEVANIPLKQREEKRQAFSKEGGAGKQGGTDNHQSRGQVPHSQQPPQVGGQAISMPCEVQGCGFTTAKAEPEIAIRLLALHHKDHELGLVPANYFAPVRQVKDSEQEVAAKPAQKEGLIWPEDTAMNASW